MAEQPSKSWSWDHEAAPAPAPEVTDDDADHAVAVKPQIITTVPAAAATTTAALLPLSMVLVQAFTMVMLLISKLALDTGMRPYVLLVYRNLVAAVVVAPLALIFEREMLKTVNLAVFGWLSVNATFGVVLAMGLYYYGLRATSASYSVIFLNLIPIVTFVIAVILRLERLDLGKWPGKMKVLGAFMCVGGTMMVSLLRVRPLHLRLWPTLLHHHHHLLSSSYYSHQQQQAPPPPPAASSQYSHHQLQLQAVAGTCFLCGSCLSYALWFIVQARVAKVFPSRYWATTLTCLIGSVQSLAVGVLLGHGDDKAEWSLEWDLKLLTVVYSGVFNTGITFVLVSWAISRRGPLYPPMFNSVSLIVTGVMDSALLGTSIYLGSVAGSLLIVAGLYAFLWGKAKETKQHLAVEMKQQQQQQQPLPLVGGDDAACMA